VFGIDFEALLLLAVLAFILFGPQKLPEYAAKLGCLIAKLRQASADLNQQCQTGFPNPLAPTPPPAKFGEITMACPLCAQEVGIDFTFCPKCGHRLKEAAAPAPPPSQPRAS
jgi:hypothetical protein